MNKVLLVTFQSKQRLMNDKTHHIISLYTSIQIPSLSFPSEMRHSLPSAPYKLTVTSSSKDPCSLTKQLPLSVSEESFEKIVMQHMLYSFGDDPNISNATSRNFDTCGGHSCGICHRFEADKAQDIGSKRGKLSVEDFLYLIREDMEGAGFAKTESLKQARKAFEVDEEKLASIE
ncbi:hypothetical protein Pint_06775 [Pistacia integerrima]|uniref:Uncharacterized protein n=1 Tax=Pistacia integerrima TaxID=434235 RepID=A0ACC0XS53_9ROSI|nr:hypothetical protein Pint_06775 [Pistacia integerrima]